MTAWTQQEIRRLASLVTRQLINDPDHIVMLEASVIPAFKVKHYETLVAFLDIVPYCIRVASDENPKTKVDLLLFGRSGTAQKLWARVKGRMHTIVTQANQDTKDFEDDEDADLIKSANDAVVAKAKDIRRRAKQRIESCYGVDLSPRRIIRS